MDLITKALRASGTRRVRARHLISVTILSALMLGFAVPAWADTVVVSQSNMGTWQTATTGTHPNTTVGFVNGPSTPPSGSGSVRMTLGAAGEFATLRTAQFAGMRLDAITNLSYSTYVAENTLNAISLKLWINQGDSPTNDHLIFEPSTVGNGTVLTGVWQNWNALPGNWWKTSAGAPGQGPGQAFTLAAYLALHPDAIIAPVFQDSLALETGCSCAGGQGSNGNVDALVLNDDTYDFENVGGTQPTTSPASNAKVRSADAPFVSATYNQDLGAAATLQVRNKNATLLAGTTTQTGPDSATGGKRTIRFTPATALSTAGSPYTATADPDFLGGVPHVWTFEIDDAAPGVPIINAPAQNALLNTATPTVSGTAEANSTVRVRRTAAPSTLAVTNADAMGNWSTPVSLSDGAHTIWATATDTAGNLSANSTQRSFTIDTVAPAAPVITTPVNGSSFATQMITITGTSEANASIDVRDGAAVVAIATANGSGNWSVTHTFSDGSHSLTAVARDAATNQSAASSPAVGITIDTTAPNAPVINQPAQNAVLGDTSVTVAGTAEANSSVKVYEGATLKVTVTATGGNWSAPGVTFAEGEHTIFATATDALGNISTASANRTFTVDDSSPTPVINTPIQNLLTNQANQTVSGTAEAGSTVTVKDGATTIGSPVANGSGAWSFSSTFADGPHALTAQATDTLSNVSPISATRDFTVDTTQPAAPAISVPAESAVVGSNSVTVSGTVPVGDAGSTIEIREGATSLGTATANGSGNWSTVLTMADGQHQITARATDPAGNLGAASGVRTFSVDGQDIAFVTSNPADGDIRSSVTSVTATFSEPLEGGTIVLRDVSNEIVAGTVTRSGNTVTFTAAEPLPEAGSAYEATATGEEYGPGSATEVFSFIVDSSIPAAPVITTPAQNAVLGSSNVTVSGTAEENSDVTVYQGSSNTVLGTTTAGPTGSWSANITFAEGSHAITATATDAADNEGPRSGTRNFSVDLTGPAVTITAPADGASLGAATVTISGTTEAGASVEVRKADNTLVGSDTADGDGDWSVPGTFAEGSHAVKARGTDTLGNLGAFTALRNFTVDLTAPDTTITSGPAALTNANSASFTFTSEAGATFECKLDAGSFAACTSPHTVNMLADGSHTMQVRAKDAAGNADATPATHTWTVDTAAPETAIDSGPSAPVNPSTATFTFSANESGSTFECSLDNAAFAACVSPKDYTGLSSGAHTFRVRATDPAGNQDATPAASAWTVDATAPDTSITSGPTGTTNSTSASFGFNSDEPGATFECRLDAGSFAACTSPKAYTGLTEGSHTFEVRAVDSVGNVDASPASRTWSIDVTAPAVPTIGQPTEDATLTSKSVLLSGTAVAGTTVRIYEGASSVAMATADGSGNWSVTHTFATDGAKTVRATATDGAGNESAATADRHFSIDSTPPGVPVISTPSEGASFNNTTVALGGTAEAGSTVRVYEGATLKATTTATGTGTWTSSAIFGEGNHSITATATDAVGNVSGASAPRGFSVDSVAPLAPVITSPAEGATTPGVVPVAGTSEGGATVRIREGATLVGTAVANASGQWSTSISFLSGPHAITATATDAANNTGPASAVRNFTVSTDTTAPLAPVITSPAAGSVNGPTVTIAGTAEPLSTVLLTYPGTSTNVPVDGAGNWSTFGTFPTGTHTVTARARDAAGNIGPAATRTFEVDANRPSVTIDNEEGQVFAPGETFTLTGDATDNKGVREVEVEFYDVLGTKVLTVPATVTPADGSPVDWTATATGLLPGRYTVRAYSVDLYGNRSTAATKSFIALNVI